VSWTWLRAANDRAESAIHISGDSGLGGADALYSGQNPEFQRLEMQTAEFVVLVGGRRGKPPPIWTG